MSDDVVIDVRNLSKIYRLYAEPRDRLLQLVHPLRRKYYREFAALDDVTFSIRRGESVAFIGKNGAGKSTLLKAITGILTPTSGVVDVRGKISALLELGTGFNPELTGRENVYFSGAIMGVGRADMDKRLDAILAFADISGYIDQPVKRYSSGMFVRLAFAVAVHVDPEILIVDEALSVGDMRFQQKCYRRIREFKDAGVTVLFVSHDMGSVLSFCSRCLWLKDGKVEQDGAPVDVSRAYSAYMNYDAELAAPVLPEAPAPTEPSEASTIAWQDVSAFSSFGDRGAVITRVAFSRSGEGGRLELLRGNERVELSMEVVFHQDMYDPLYGLLLKDGYGNQILSINSFVYEHTPMPRKKGDRVVFRFEFKFPLLRNGEYTMSVALAQGTLDAHVQHHWVHDVLVLQVANNDLPHRLGCTIVVEDVALSES
jgi:ABC-type polysaccharide/polyol phosphate transport system ATPase subunit